MSVCLLESTLCVWESRPLKTSKGAWCKTQTDTHAVDKRQIKRASSHTQIDIQAHTYSVMVDNSDILHECWTACVGSLKHFWAQLLYSTKTTQHNKDSVFRDTQSHTAHTHTSSHLVTHVRVPATDDNDIICRGLKRHRPVGTEQESDVWLQHNSIMRRQPPANR